MIDFDSVYKGKKVLVTGHTGFKGSWLSLWLQSLGADVIGVSDRVPTNPSHFDAIEMARNLEDIRLDVLEGERLGEVLKECRPDFVFHLAAQALVKESYANPIRTFQTNAIGSLNVLEALRSVSYPVTVIMITSDKVYDNVEWVWGYRETDTLGGKDPYSASKSMAEIAIRSYVSSFLPVDGPVKVGIARAGNVIGGGDWAEARIVPDCMTAWSEKKAVSIRNPSSTRPWQHVLEPLGGYLLLGRELHKDRKHHGEAYNFGPAARQSHSVADLINEMEKHWKNVRWEDLSGETSRFHEAGLLKLNCDKAAFHLRWQPVLEFEETVQFTVDWYREFYQGRTMRGYSLQQIQNYSKKAGERNLEWI